MKLNELVYQIYNTVDEPDTWQTVLAAVARELDSTHATLMVRPGAEQHPDTFIVSGFDQGYFDVYQQHFYEVDIWSHSLAKFPLNQTHNTHQLCNDREFFKSEIYNDFSKPAGIRHGIGCLMINAELDTFLQFGILRGKELGYYDEALRLRAYGLTQHIQQALSIAQHLRQMNGHADGFQQLLNNTHEPILICDDKQVLLQHNDEAERLLHAGDLIRLNCAKQLVFMERNAQIQFEFIKAQMGLHFNLSGAASFTLRNQHYAYQLKMQPWLHSHINALGTTKIPSLLLTLRPIRSEANLSMQDMVDYFGFTRAEAEVTELLCQRQSVEEIATTRNTSLHTVRRQVKTCIHKAQCRNQVELVSKVLMTLMD